MIEEVNFNLDVAKEAMDDVISRLEFTLSKIRAGKANPQMLSSVKLDYYGVQTPLSQAANIASTDAQTLSIQPFDKNLISDIEQAIVEANLGFNPSNNGEKVIVNVPPLTEERRKDLVKQVKSEIENAKVSIRNHRQKANDDDSPEPGLRPGAAHPQSPVPSQVGAAVQEHGTQHFHPADQSAQLRYPHSRAADQRCADQSGATKLSATQRRGLRVSNG